MNHTVLMRTKAWVAEILFETSSQGPALVIREEAKDNPLTNAISLLFFFFYIGYVSPMSTHARFGGDLPLGFCLVLLFRTCTLRAHGNAAHVRTHCQVRNEWRANEKARRSSFLGQVFSWRLAADQTDFRNVHFQEVTKREKTKKNKKKQKKKRYRTDRSR